MAYFERAPMERTTATAKIAIAPLIQSYVVEIGMDRHTLKLGVLAISKSLQLITSIGDRPTFAAAVLLPS